MNVERFVGPDLSAAMLRVHRSLGPDAMILRSGRVDSGVVEVLAAEPGEVEALRRQLEEEPASLGRKASLRVRPPVITLIGAAGAGKTTALMKLALDPRAYGGRRVGILTLDTWGVGSLEQIRLYAGVARVPVEVVHDAADAEGALRRFRDREVILVDTPGRLVPTVDGPPEWARTLRALEPDETHWVCPATLRPSVVRSVHRRLEPVRPTHVLVSQMDEGGRDGDALEVARAACLPGRWVTGGAELPGTLRPALAGLMDAVGGHGMWATVPRAAEPGRAAARAG